MLLVPHRLPGSGLSATVIRRTNRFLARCHLDDGNEVDAHVPDRGRLLGIIEPGARARLYASSNPLRKTAFTLLVCEEASTGVAVAIDPAGANLRVEALLRAGLIPSIPPEATWRREVTWGASRFDFRIETARGPILVEVKSVGAARDGVGLFPDAPTERGRRQIEELSQFVRGGHGEARVIFVAQRGDVRRITIDRSIDPEFGRTIDAHHDVLRLSALGFDVRDNGLLFQGPLPFTT